METERSKRDNFRPEHEDRARKKETNFNGWITLTGLE